MQPGVYEHGMLASERSRVHLVECVSEAALCEYAEGRHVGEVRRCIRRREERGGVPGCGCGRGRIRRLAAVVGCSHCCHCQYGCTSGRFHVRRSIDGGVRMRADRGAQAVPPLPACLLLPSSASDAAAAATYTMRAPLLTIRSHIRMQSQSPCRLL